MNKFQIEVQAIDRFTKTFRNLNDRASKAVRPLTNVQRQVGSLVRELHLDKLVTGMGKVSRASLSVSRNLGAATGPLESLLGLGATGGFIGAAGAIAALGARWGQLGYEVNRTSQLIGVSTAELQRYRGAANLAGVSSEVMTDALSRLGTTLQDALNNRNPTAVVMLNKLGIGIRRNAEGVVDTTAALTDLSRAISRVRDPHVQAVIASAFGLEGALPLLRQGPDIIERNAREAERLGLVMGGPALEGAQKFGDALNRLKAAAEGAANATGAKLVGPLARGMDLITSGITSASRPNQGVAEAAGNAARAVFGGPKLLGTMLFGGETDRSKQRSSGIVTGSSAASDERWHIDPAVQAERDRESVRMMQLEYDRETNPALKANMWREIQRRQGALAGEAAAASGTPAPQPPVRVEIDMRNVQPGVSVRASQGNLWVPTRINYAMPAAVGP